MTAPRGKACAFALVASLALNLFLGGVFASRWMRRPPQTAFDPGAFSVMRLRRALGPDVAPAIDRALGGRRAELVARMQAASEARDRATMALEAEPFDRQRAAENLADFRAKTSAVQETMHAAVVDLAAELTPEQRRRLAETVDRAGPGGMGPHRRHNPRMGIGPAGNSDTPVFPGIPSPGGSR